MSAASRKKAPGREVSRDDIQTTAVVRIPRYLAVELAAEAKRRRVLVARILFERLDPTQAKKNPRVPRGWARRHREGLAGGAWS